MLFFSHYIYYKNVIWYYLAICEPECENGGVCLRDDECKCKHFTSGKHCEDGKYKNIFFKNNYINLDEHSTR
jgi:hypothetical protein